MGETYGHLGPGSFQTNAVLDWVADAEDTTNLNLFADTLSRAVSWGDDCEFAIAAAEAVAALLGKAAPDLPEELERWLAALRASGQIDAPDLVDLAQRALVRITTNSELKELLDEGIDPAQWYASVADLQARLRA